jgi:muramoyltetrapeptide carboxypeptidase
MEKRPSIPLLKPPRLRTGDTIGVISPAGPVRESELMPGIGFLESRGFRVNLAPHVLDVEDYLAGTDADRLGDLHAFVREPEIKAIFCARGGYGSMRLLRDIDYDLIKGSSKIMVGYSDITSLILAVHKKTGMVTVHGPMVREYIHGKESNLEGLLEFLMSRSDRCMEITVGEAVRHGRARGRLVGGNLSLICHLVGTPFLPSFDEGILFLEDRGEAPYRVDRMLTHLALSGRLDKVSGLIFGDFEKCGEASTTNRLIESFSRHFHFPVVRGFQVGHGRTNVPLPIGVEAELDTKGMTLRLLESWSEA